MKNILLLSFILIATSCLKDENAIIIQGVITDAYSMEPMRGAKVELHKASSGFFGSQQKLMETTSSDENGFYQFKFRPPNRDKVGAFI